ncbi:MAG: glycosyltransferase [Deltaproteobacteria bacterium]|nr:glycosyltransferase [Deltaproteobacteria bacterium]MDH3382462.1 glycosyltransferase [Deltaproteobacteria bacterium]
MPAKITYLLPNIESGGTERHVLTLGRRLDRARFSPSLLTTAGGGSLYKDFSEVMPVTVHGGNPTRSKRFRSSPWEHFRTIRLLAGEFRRTRPDILHAYLPSSNILWPIAAKITGVTRVIVSKRGMANCKTHFTLLPRVEPLGNRLADRLAAAILEIAGDPDRGKRCGEAGRRLAQERFSLLRMVAEFEEMYETLAAREGVPG